MESDLIAYLLADAGVAAVLGSEVHFTEWPASGVQPAAALVLGPSFGDVEKTSRGLVRRQVVTVQSEVWALDPAVAIAAVDAVVAAISGIEARRAGCLLNGSVDRRGGGIAKAPDGRRMIRAIVDLNITFKL